LQRGSAIASPRDLEDRYAAFQDSTPLRSSEDGGVVWRWREAGAGAPALIVLPGAVGGGDIFFVLVQELAARSRVLTVDLPFFTSANEAVAALDRFLEARGVESAVLLGASFSGLLVQVYAVRFPARTAGLILSHTGALDPARAGRTRRFAARARRIPIGIAQLLLRLIVTGLTRAMGSERRFWRRLYGDAIRNLTREALVSRYELAASLNDAGGGAGWQGPVLVIHSDNDDIARPIEAARLRAAYPRASFREFRGAGHSSYSSRPLEYASVVREFLQSTSAQAAR
jgi:pimeloyl-ACP methyl ester carboxylesterase